MRPIKSLSPSSFKLAEGNTEEFYKKYMADTRPDRVPQERPASAGSAFDAHAKAALYSTLIGDGNPKYTLENLFKEQVEPHNREWALPEGKYIFDEYVRLGAYDSLLQQLKNVSEPPRFEFEVNAVIGGVPITGKPDCRFITSGTIHVVHDWKLNGYCSKRPTSPTQGYQYCWPDDKAHKLYIPQAHGDMTISAGYLEDYDSDWADQLCIYGWCMGEKIGDQNVVLQIHQIVAKPIPDKRPLLRVAQLRCRVRDSYQDFLLKRLQRVWEHIQEGHVLHNLPYDEAMKRQESLDKETVCLVSDGTPEGDFFVEAVKPKFRG